MINKEMLIQEEILKQKLFWAEDEGEIMIPPYVIVTYIDDYGKMHLATVKDNGYLSFLKTRFIVVDCKEVEKIDVVSFN